jgi:hypothetical protein
MRTGSIAVESGKEKSQYFTRLPERGNLTWGRSGGSDGGGPRGAREVAGENQAGESARDGDEEGDQDEKRSSYGAELTEQRDRSESTGPGKERKKSAVISPTRPVA